MNRTRLLMIGVVAIALGALASFAAYSRMKGSTAADTRPGVDVVVAASDLGVGGKIEAQDIKLVRFPQGDLPPKVFNRMSQVIGQGVVLPISQGEFVLPNKLAGQNAGSGLPSLIPQGMRAISVRVNEVVSVAGFVVPGTRVDVLLTGNPTGANEQQTTTVLENVAVIATGQKLERNSAGEPQTTPVITLLVSPDDAQKLTLASTQGRIQLSLRNPLDTRQQDLGAVNTNNLYKGVAVKSMAPTAPKTAGRAKHVAQPATPPPSAYSVEVIEGSKKNTVTF